MIGHHRFGGRGRDFCRSWSYANDTLNHRRTWKMGEFMRLVTMVTSINNNTEDYILYFVLPYMGFSEINLPETMLWCVNFSDFFFFFVYCTIWISLIIIYEKLICSVLLGRKNTTHPCCSIVCTHRDPLDVPFFCRCGKVGNLQHTTWRCSTLPTQCARGKLENLSPENIQCTPRIKEI